MSASNRQHERGTDRRGNGAGRIALQAPVEFRGAIGQLWATVLATARAQVQRWSAYLIDVLRMPLSPLLMFATWQITYNASGQRSVGGANVPGFLLVGMVGMITWTSTIWASGYAIEMERQEGTAGALFLSPASRVAVVAGYGLGSFIWLAPSFLVVLVLGFATGAQLHIADPLAVLGAVLALLAGSLACGFAFAGLFVLSRRGNLLANFLQTPIYLLAGFIVPRSALPDWLRPLSDLIPASHAVDALRASSLLGAGLASTLPEIVLALATSALFALIGIVGLRRVEHVAKRSGVLDLY